MKELIHNRHNEKLVSRRQAVMWMGAAALGIMTLSGCQHADKGQPIIYNLDGGVNPEGQVKTVCSGENIALDNLLDPSKDGYDFVRWTCRAENGTSSNAINVNARHVYANWSLATYTLSFALRGGTQNYEQVTRYTIESKDIELLEPSMKAHVFEGWYSDADFTQEASRIPRGSTGDKTFYAKWDVANYWKDELDRKIRRVKELKEQIGEDGDQFAFITDIHWERNLKASSHILHDVVEMAELDKVVCGGDLINGNEKKKIKSGEFVSRDRALALLKHWTERAALDEIEKADGQHVKLYYLRGNHDNNSVDLRKMHPERLDELRITDEELSELFLKPAGVEPQGSRSCPLYYHIDVERPKIRYICLDTGEDEEIMGDDQVEWAKGLIKECPKNWTVIMLAHKMFSMGKVEANGNRIIDDIIKPTATDSTVRCTVAACITGHTHKDISSQDKDNKQGSEAKNENSPVPLITTTCDANGMAKWWADEGIKVNRERYYETYMNKLSNRTDELAFDVITIDTQVRKLYFTRIGAGEDREFSY